MDALAGYGSDAASDTDDTDANARDPRNCLIIQPQVDVLRYSDLTEIPAKRRKIGTSEASLTVAVQSDWHEPQCVDGHPAPRHSIPRVTNASSRDRPEERAVGRQTRAVCGRYVPKRERHSSPTSQTGGHAPGGTRGHATTAQPTPPLNTLAVIEAPEQRGSTCPSRLKTKLMGHTNHVTCVRWSPGSGSTLASCSLDGSVRLWGNPWSGLAHNSQARAAIACGAPVREGQWRGDGEVFVTASYDGCVREISAGRSEGSPLFSRPGCTATTVRYHPEQPAVVLAGFSSGEIVAWDVRSNESIREFKGAFGLVQDVEFLSATEFASCSDVARRNSTDKGILVWDFASGAIMSNQVFQEAFTCTTLRRHPAGNTFIAQCNADYIALFSASRPYKLDKRKRYESHVVGGRRIGCGFSPDGRLVCTGSADGRLVVYDGRSARVLATISAHEGVTSDCAFHPTRASAVATAGWDGAVAVWE